MQSYVHKLYVFSFLGNTFRKFLSTNFELALQTIVQIGKNMQHGGNIHRGTRMDFLFSISIIIYMKILQIH